NALPGRTPCWHEGQPDKVLCSLVRQAPQCKPLLCYCGMRWHNQPNSVWQEKEMTQSALAKTISAVRSAFRGYYFMPNMIETPDMIEQREFGYMQFGQVGMVRHLSFISMKELTATIIKEVPADIYCSNAYYRFPTYPMQEKQWLG